MTGRIVAAGLIAVLFYIIIPALSRLSKSFRRKRLMDRLRSASGISAFCIAFRNENLIISPIGKLSDETAQITISPRKTRFFMLEKTGSFEELSWKTVFLIQNGITLVYYPGKRKHSRATCLFHEETKEKAIASLIAGLGERVEKSDALPDPVKYFSIAIGVFIEFCLFLETLTKPGQSRESIAAIVAIFGKALPYCPPGLFLTLFARIAHRHDNAKKNRQRAAVGFMLVTAGVVLNVAVILFVILRIGAVNA